MYTALLFDLDNTLVDRDAAVRAHFSERLREYSPDRSSMLDEVLARDRSGYGDRYEFLAWYQAEFAPEMSTRELMIEMRFGIMTRLRPYRGVKTMIGRLSKAFTLGLLSNGSGSGQRLKLEGAGLDRYFEPERICISGELAYAKPDPNAFLKALEKLGHDPGTTLMVGDDPVNDIAGATEAGLATCWVSHGRAYTGDWPPTHTIQHPSELPTILQP